MLSTEFLAETHGEYRVGLQIYVITEQLVVACEHKRESGARVSWLHSVERAQPDMDQLKVKDRILENISLSVKKVRNLCTCSEGMYQPSLVYNLKDSFIFLRSTLSK